MVQLFVSRIARVALIVFILFAALGTPAVTAQTTPPPVPPQPRSPEQPPVEGAVYDEQAGDWMMPAEFDMASADMELPMASGVPDMYGYNWSDGTTTTWYDAVGGGINSGLTGSINQTGAIPLPFPFKYYENTYTSIYISAFGFLTFDGNNYWNSQSAIPNTSKPNNVIAPLWGPLDLASSGSNNRVFYKTIGTGANQMFVVQWNKVLTGLGTNYTFEAVLFANGNIWFQYGTMNIQGNYFCTSVGMEDSRGVDGFAYMGSSCYNPGNLAGKTIKITRPAASARALIYPDAFGKFVKPAQTAELQIPIVNTGELGTDRFDLVVSSTWPVTLYDQTNRNPLTDTNGNGILDSGPVAAGATYTVNLRFQTPDFLAVGENSSGTLTVTPSVGAGHPVDVSFTLAVPAPFAQVYGEQADSSLSLMLARPDTQSTYKVASEAYGYYPSVAELPDGNFIYAWSQSRCLDSNCSKHGAEIYYTIRSKSGGTVKDITRLSDITPFVITQGYDENPAIAVSPNGTVMIVWVRWLYNANYDSNTNIMMARITSAGVPAGGTVNVTQNAAYGNTSINYHPDFQTPAVTATADNRFMLAWQRRHYVNNARVNDLYTAGYASNGTVVLPVTQRTADTAGSSESYYSPKLTALNNNRVLLVYEHYLSGANLEYRVLNSAGGEVFSTTNLTTYGYAADAVQLSGGNILVAWTTYTRFSDADKDAIWYAVLDSSYQRIGNHKMFYPITTDGDDFVSVTADQSGNGILTWTNQDWDSRTRVNYGLVNEVGDVLTPPMVIKFAVGGLILNDLGNNLTSNTLPTAAAGAVDLAAAADGAAGAAPGGMSQISFSVQNLGTLKATGVTLTVVLPPGANSPDGNCTGGVCTFNLQEMGFMCSGKVYLNIQVPNDPIGTVSEAQYSITSAENDPAMSNNSGTFKIFTATQLYLPVTTK